MIEVQRDIQGSFKGVPSTILWYFKEVSRVFEESFKGVSRKIDESFNGYLSGVLGCLKEVQWVYKESFNSAPRWFRGIF